ALRAFEAPASLERDRAEVAADREETCADLVGAGGKTLRRIRITDDGGPPRPHDAGLLPADRLAVRAEPFGMVEIDARDQRRIGVDRVRRVEAAAHADLEDRDVRVPPLEEEKRRDGRRLEIRQRDRTEARLDRFKDLDQLGIRRVAAVEADPLVEAHEMRRRERTDTIARRAIDALQDRDARALAVRAADRDHLVARRDEMERVEDHPDPIEAHVDL